MQARLLSDIGGQRIFAVIFGTGDDVLKILGAFVKAQRIDAAQLTAIGAFENAVLGYFDWKRKDYIEIVVPEQTEVASLIGDVASGDGGEPVLRIHCVLSHRDGAAKAGHLLRANVRPTLEVILTESPAHLRKRHDPESGLALIDPTRTEV